MSIASKVEKVPLKKMWPNITRKEAMARARANSNIEGLDVFPEDQKVLDAYTEGLISDDEARKQILENSRKRILASKKK